MLIIAYILGGWVWTNSYIRFLKERQIWKICHQYIKIVPQNELIFDHDYFHYIFNSNAMPELGKMKYREIVEEGGYDQNLM